MTNHDRGMIRATFAAVVLALASTAVQAQAYRWTDEQGRVRYTDTPPPKSAKDARKLQSPSGSAPAVDPRGAPAGGGGPQPAKAGTLPELTLYTNSGCAQLCLDARNHLLGRGAKFREIEVEAADSLAELRKVSGSTSVPVLLVGSAVQRGYEALRYDRMLDAAGFPKADPARAAATPRAPLGPYAPGATPPGPQKK